MRRVCWVGLFTAFTSGLASAQELSQVPKTFSAYSRAVTQTVTFQVDLALPPEAASHPVPAVILLHGCGGPNTPDATWRKLFYERGYASLRLESNVARGWPKSICPLAYPSGRAGQLDRSAEAFAGARMLRRLPFIDKDRIIVMGFSHGAGAALLIGDGVSAKYWRDMGMGDVVEPINAVIAEYPWCGNDTERATWFYGHGSRLVAPTLILIGAEDQTTPVQFCQRYVEDRRSQNPETLKLVVLTGATHSFDNGRPVTEYIGCGGINGTCNNRLRYGHNEEAFQTAQKTIAAFLGRHLGL